MTSRREWMAGALASAGLLAAPAVRADASWPNRPVKLIVPFPPGVVHDALSRVLAENLRGKLGQNFIVENLTGAGGNIGMSAAAKSAPDGYTVLSATVGTLSINQFLYASMPYDPDRDFVPVSLLWQAPNGLFVSAEKNPARTLQEFIAWAKARPQGTTFGSAGIGTTPHLCGELFKMRTGVSATHVPYRDSGQRLMNLVTGELDFAIDNVASYGSLLRDGKVRGLAVTSDSRWPAVAEVPTMAEAGLSDFVVTSWAAIMMPRGVPEPIVARLGQAVKEIMADPAFQERYMAIGGKAVWTSPQDTAAHIARERILWGDVVRNSGARFG